MIRALSPTTDVAAVLDLQVRAADYMALETGRFPDESTAAEFFAEVPPGSDPAASLKLGLWDASALAGIADVAFGYPEANDAYVGLMLLAPDARSRGLGAGLLAHILEVVRARGAGRLLVAVLDDNPRGRAFWERHGFTEERRFPPQTTGERTHVRIRMTRAV